MSIYDNKFFDLSSIVNDFAASNDINAYQFEFWNTILKPYVHEEDLKETSGIYQLVFSQNSQVYQTRLNIVTFDQVLAFIGGYISLVYATFAAFTNPYRNYNLDMTLIKQIYQQDGRDGRLGEEPVFKNDNDLINHRYMNMRQPIVLSYPKMIWFKMLTKFCPCFKKTQCLARMKEVLRNNVELRERLSLELDIVEILKGIRYSRVLSKIKLTKL